MSARDVHVDASTIFGLTKAQTLHASNSILLGKVTVERRQQGCVRFCYLPFDSESPRRYRCQPDATAQASRVRPRFESVSFGEPAYGQLTGATCSGSDFVGKTGSALISFIDAADLSGCMYSLYYGSVDQYRTVFTDANIITVSNELKARAVNYQGNDSNHSMNLLSFLRTAGYWSFMSKSGDPWNNIPPGSPTSCAPCTCRTSACRCCASTARAMRCARGRS